MLWVVKYFWVLIWKDISSRRMDYKIYLHKVTTKRYLYNTLSISKARSIKTPFSFSLFYFQWFNWHSVSVTCLGKSKNHLNDIWRVQSKLPLWNLRVFRIRYFWTPAHIIFGVHAPNLFYSYILRDLVIHNLWYVSKGCIWPCRNLQILIFAWQREKTAK